MKLVPMTSHSLFAMRLAILSAVQWAVAQAAPADLDGLARNSPFSGAPTTAAGNSADTTLEFRGVLVDRGETFFSLFEVSTRQSLWVGLKEAGNPYLVQNYDGNTAQLQVQYQGKTLTLPLKQAKVGTMVATASVNNQPPAGNNQSNVSANAPADEARRLAAVAEEIRRRRALRQQAIQAPAPVTPPRN